MENQNNIQEANLEPFEYFEKVKASVNQVQKEQLEEVQNFLEYEITKAKNLNQIVLANDLIFTFDVLGKELLAFNNGFNRYIERNLLHKFLDYVLKKSTIKACELERYPRVIPEENAIIIKKAQELGIFDKYMVVFTDLEDQVKNTEADQKFIERNKDPIVFGYFHDIKNNKKYDRFYVITDWVDEYCDLTFDKMVREIGSLKIDKKYQEKLGTGNINDARTYVETEMSELYGRNITIVKENQTLFSKFKKFFK